MKIGILIPVFNEAQSIGAVVESLRGKNWSVLVVDDGSGDGSGAIAQENGAGILRHETKQGKGRSLQDGFRRMLSEGYDGIITMDGDGQHAPEDIEQFVREAQKYPASVITGNRMHNSHGMPLVRCLTNRFMSWMISAACRRSIPDTQCGFRYIGREVLAAIRLTRDDFEIETEILMKACRKGFPVYSIPIQTIYRSEKSHIHPLKDTARFFSYFLPEILRKPSES